MFTKGEWKVSSKSFGGADTGEELVIWSPSGIVAMACTIHEGLVNAEANARLIAQAPKLYEELKHIRDGLKALGLFKNDTDRMDKVLAKVEK